MVALLAHLIRFLNALDPFVIAAEVLIKWVTAHSMYVLLAKATFVSLRPPAQPPLACTPDGYERAGTSMYKKRRTVCSSVCLCWMEVDGNELGQAVRAADVAGWRQQRR